jgi:hypothetical protein
MGAQNDVGNGLHVQESGYPGASKPVKKRYKISLKKKKVQKILTSS